MPASTMETVKKQESALKQALAALGEAPDRSEQRGIAKKLRRAQRLRRRMAVEAARAVKAAPAAAKEASAPEASAE